MMIEEKEEVEEEEEEVMMVVEKEEEVMMMVEEEEVEEEGAIILLRATPSSAGNLSLSGAFTTQPPHCILLLALHCMRCTGCIKKMVHSDFSLKSVQGVGFYFFRDVLEPAFCA